MKRFYVGEVSINHSEIAQIAASGFLKKVQETGQIPEYSFDLPVSTGWLQLVRSIKL